MPEGRFCALKDRLSGNCVPSPWGELAGSTSGTDSSGWRELAQALLLSLTRFVDWQNVSRGTT